MRIGWRPLAAQKTAPGGDCEPVTSRFESLLLRFAAAAHLGFVRPVDLIPRNEPAPWA
jgi:hypothetical protein